VYLPFTKTTTNVMAVYEKQMILVLQQDSELAIKISSKQEYAANEKCITTLSTVNKAAIYLRKCTGIDNITRYLKLQ
jgi:hypothetical protein